MFKFFAIMGLICAGLLSFIDFWTSYIGIYGVLPPETRSWEKGWVLPVIPWILAALAITLNGSTAHLFRHVNNQGFGSLPTKAFFLIWLGFVLYDWSSSCVGLISEFKGYSVGVDEILSAFFSLTISQRIVAVAVALLASSGPFLVSMFSDLLKES